MQPWDFFNGVRSLFSRLDVEKKLHFGRRETLRTFPIRPETYSHPTMRNATNNLNRTDLATRRISSSSPLRGKRKSDRSVPLALPVLGTTMNFAAFGTEGAQGTLFPQIDQLPIGSRSHLRGGLLILVTFVLTILLAARPSVANSIAEAQPQDDVWLISSREAPAFSQSTADDEDVCDQLYYWHDAGDSDWVASSRKEFLATGQFDSPTIFFVHGNRMSAYEALPRGLKVFRRLFCDNYRKPVRYVIWSWPSAPIKGRVKDVRLKAYLSQAHAYYLAKIVDEMDDDLPVGFVGYSFGARLIAASLHLLGGGEVVGQRLDPGVVERHHPMRAVLVAAALDNDWLLPGRNYGCALPQLERIMVVVNHRDPALRLYPLLRRGPMPEALGFTGLPFDRHADGLLRRVEQLDVSESVGKAHALKNYISARKLATRIGPFLSFPDTHQQQPVDG